MTNLEQIFTHCGQNCAQKGGSRSTHYHLCAVTPAAFAAIPETPFCALSRRSHCVLLLLVPRLKISLTAKGNWQNWGSLSGPLCAKNRGRGWLLYRSVIMTQLLTTVELMPEVIRNMTKKNENFMKYTHLILPYMFQHHDEIFRCIFKAEPLDGKQDLYSRGVLMK